MARREAVIPSTAEHLLSLQRAVGNRAVVAGLAAGQAKLGVGRVGDADEHDEDIPALMALIENKAKDLADPHSKVMAIKLVRTLLYRSAEVGSAEEVNVMMKMLRERHRALFERPLGPDDGDDPRGARTRDRPVTS